MLRNVLTASCIDSSYQKPARSAVHAQIPQSCCLQINSCSVKEILARQTFGEQLLSQDMECFQQACVSGSGIHQQTKEGIMTQCRQAMHTKLVAIKALAFDLRTIRWQHLMQQTQTCW